MDDEHVVRAHYCLPSFPVTIAQMQGMSLFMLFYPCEPCGGNTNPDMKLCHLSVLFIQPPRLPLFLHLSMYVCINLPMLCTSSELDTHVWKSKLAKKAKQHTPRNE